MNSIKFLTFLFAFGFFSCRDRTSTPVKLLAEDSTPVEQVEIAGIKIFKIKELEWAITEINFSRKSVEDAKNRRVILSDAITECDKLNSIELFKNEFPGVKWGILSSVADAKKLHEKMGEKLLDAYGYTSHWTSQKERSTASSPNSDSNQVTVEFGKNKVYAGSLDSTYRASFFCVGKLQ